MMRKVIVTKVTGSASLIGLNLCVAAHGRARVGNHRIRTWEESCRGAFRIHNLDIDF